MQFRKRPTIAELTTGRFAACAKSASAKAIVRELKIKTTPSSGMQRSSIFAALLELLLLMVPMLSPAAEYPTQPIRILVGYSAGGSNDMVARIVAPALGEILGQQVIVENRPGAGGNIAADAVAKGPTDGYAVLLSAGSTMSILPSLQRMPFDVDKDFAPVIQVANTPFIAWLNSSLPITNVKELVAYANAHPGKINFASGGNGTTSHLAGEMLKKRLALNIVHIPYKGTAQAVADLQTNQVSLMFDQPLSALAYSQGGKVRAIGVAARRRLASLPDVPTFIEQGVPDFDPVPWLGIHVRSGTPPAVIEKLSTAFSSALQRPEVKGRLTRDSIEVVQSSPAAFRAFVAVDRKKWETFIREAKITLQ